MSTLLSIGDVSEAVVALSYAIDIFVAVLFTKMRPIRGTTVPVA
jgi:hypothetical protein